jgi:hypothetical protein
MPRKKRGPRFNTARAEKASRAQFELTCALAKNPPFEVRPAPLVTRMTSFDLDDGHGHRVTYTAATARFLPATTRVIGGPDRPTFAVADDRSIHPTRRRP